MSKLKKVRVKAFKPMMKNNRKRNFLLYKTTNVSIKQDTRYKKDFWMCVF